MQAANIRIGVDGGGSSCRAALVRGDRRFDRVGGPANVSDFDGAIETICTTLQELFFHAGASDVALGQGVVHLGLAGAGDEAVAARVEATLRDHLPVRSVSVSDDQRTTIAGALGPDDGAVVGIGTGSFVGRQAGGQVRVVGGRGFLLGDQASGAWLGKRALQELMLAEDGLAPHSGLTRDLLSRHDGNIAGVVAFAIAARPADFARLAPDVVAAAKADDPVGARLMRDGADYIAGALASLGWRAGEALCLTGGLGPAYVDWLPRHVAASIVAARGSALDGALVLAGQRVPE